MKKKLSYFIFVFILLWMAVVMGFEVCHYYGVINDENTAMMICLFMGEQAAETSDSKAALADRSEKVTRECISDVESDKQEEMEEQDRIRDVLMKNEEKIDEEFAGWLCEHYSEACDDLAVKMESGEYKDTLWYEETGKSIFVLKDEAVGILDSEQSMQENLIYEKTCAAKDYVSLSFAGDVSFANDYAPAQNYTREGIDGAFSPDLQKTMSQADIFMLNNEFCYSTGGSPVPKGYNFRAAPECVSRLHEMGVDIVSIANNHAFDYGAEAFIDTIDTLNDAGMPYVGGGVDIEDAKNHIVYFIANGIKIGYIAASQVERDEPIFTQPATEDSPGVVRCFEPDLVVEMIKEAEENCDFVVVYPHWGTELVTTIQEDQQALAYAFIEAGADAIVGGHPHCLQGVEYYNGVPIFYSLSNFSFSSKTVNSAILNLQITIDGIKQARYIPCMESGGKTHQCDVQDSDYVRIIKLLNDVSENAVIDEDGIVQGTGY